MLALSLYLLCFAFLRESINTFLPSVFYIKKNFEEAIRQSKSTVKFPAFPTSGEAFKCLQDFLRIAHEKIMKPARCFIFYKLLLTSKFHLATFTPTQCLRRSANIEISE